MIWLEGFVPPDCGPAQPEPVEYYGTCPPKEELPSSLPDGAVWNWNGGYRLFGVELRHGLYRVQSSDRLDGSEFEQRRLYVEPGELDWTRIPRPHKTPPPQGGSESALTDAARAHSPEREDPPGAEAQAKQCATCGQHNAPGLDYDGRPICQDCAGDAARHALLDVPREELPERIASAKRAAPEQRHPSDWDAWSTAGWES